MKKIIMTLMAILTCSVSASALSVERSREEARFLTDKMAYELDLTDEQLQDVYEINYDYFRSLGPVNRSYDDLYNSRYEYLNYVLYDWQWDEFLARTYFLRPAYIYRGGWAFGVYNYYARTRFFYGVPSIYHHYNGGHCRRASYYRGRTPMHRNAMMNRPRPQNNRRPEMTRPNANRYIHNNRIPMNRDNVRPNNNRPTSSSTSRPTGSTRERNVTSRGESKRSSSSAERSSSRRNR